MATGLGNLNYSQTVDVISLTPVSGSVTLYTTPANKISEVHFKLFSLGAFSTGVVYVANSSGTLIQNVAAANYGGSINSQNELIFLLPDGYKIMGSLTNDRYWFTVIEYIK